MENLERMVRDATQLLGTYVPNLVAALLILVVGWIVASIVARLIQRALSRVGIGKILKHGMPEDSQETASRIQTGIGRGVFIVLMLFVLVAFFEVLGLTQITTPLTGFLNELFVFAPRLIGPLLLIIVAWAAANILRAVTRRALTSARLDERLSAGAALEPGSERAFSDTVSESVYWLTYLVFLPAVLSALNLGGLLEPVRSAVTEIVGFLPNIFAAGVILVIGWLVARVLRRITSNFLVAVGTERLSDRAELRGALGTQQLSGTVGLIVYVLVFVPVLVAALNALQLEAITAPASDMLSEILAIVPNLVAGTLIVVVAFYVARIVGGLTTSVLSSLGFDNVTQKIGLSNAQLTGQQTTSEIAGHLVHIAIMLFATIEALNLIGFVSLSVLISAFLVFAINVIFGLTIIGLGLFLGKFTADIVGTTNVPNPAIAAVITRIAIIVLAVAMGIRQMGVAEDIIALAFGLTLGALAVALAIAFGFGGRDAAAKLIEKKLGDDATK
jgi:hypothetical protein